MYDFVIDGPSQTTYERERPTDQDDAAEGFDLVCIGVLRGAS